MRTVVIQLGNSDNLLSQEDWSRFVSCVRNAICEHIADSEQLHFDGGSRYDSPWQNACFVCEIDRSKQEGLIDAISNFARIFRQDSVAVTVGETIFV